MPITGGTGALQPPVGYGQQPSIPTTTVTGAGTGSLGGDQLAGGGSTSSGSSSGGNQQNIGAAGGIVPLQGTGATPAYNAGTAAVGGNKTAGFQYGMADAGAIDQSKINPAQMPNMSVDKGENYQGQMQDAYMNESNRRMDPQWQQRQADQENQLQNMGLTRGSEAWNRESTNLSNQRNDAYSQARNQAIMASGAEAQRRQNMDIAAGKFGNEATQQGFQNQVTSQQAQNTAQGQQFGQNLASANLNNQGVAAQQGAAQGWKQIEAQNNASANQLAGQMAQAGAATSVGMANVALGQRGMENQERQQDFDMYFQSQMNPILIQNAMAQGMNPSDPNFAGVATPGTKEYQDQMNTGNTQIGSAVAGAAGQAGKIDWGSLGGNQVGSAAAP